MINRVFLVLFIAFLLACSLKKEQDDQMQSNYPRIDINKTDARFFKMYIDTTPVIMYLQFVNYSGYHAQVYSAYGWISTENDTLPICAFYDPERLTVYHFNTADGCDELLNLSGELESLWDIRTHYHHLNNWAQKFVFTDKYAFTINTRDSLSIDLINPHERDILLQRESLLLSPDKGIDLHTFFEIDNDTLAIKEAHEQYIKIYFRHPSSNYPEGRCGAGSEAGYLHLHLDSLGGFRRVFKEHTESCWEDI